MEAVEGACASGGRRGSSGCSGEQQGLAALRLCLGRPQPPSPPARGPASARRMQSGMRGPCQGQQAACHGLSGKRSGCRPPRAWCALASSAASVAGDSPCVNRAATGIATHRAWKSAGASAGAGASARGGGGAAAAGAAASRPNSPSLLAPSAAPLPTPPPLPAPPPLLPPPAPPSRSSRPSRSPGAAGAGAAAAAAGVLPGRAARAAAAARVTAAHAWLPCYKPQPEPSDVGLHRPQRTKWRSSSARCCTRGYPSACHPQGSGTGSSSRGAWSPSQHASAPYVAGGCWKTYRCSR